MEMRRGGKIGLLCLVVAVSILPAAEAKKAKRVTRTETHDYSASGGFEAVAVTTTICAQESACLVLTPKRKEKYVSLQIADTSGTPAPFSVSVNEASSVHCGETFQPVFTNGEREIPVTILGASQACSGVGTTGTVTATFSNLP